MTTGARGWRQLGLRLLAGVVVAGVVMASALAVRPILGLSTGRTFYVSRSGNNADGLSWATAWNELSRINWSAVAPGDTILVDGGPVACPSLGPGYNCGMVYNSTLSINRSGTSSAPITLRLAPDAGRNGTIVIDGGITTWSTCPEAPAELTPPANPNGAGTRVTGITLNASQWIVLDGTRWGGIEVRNHTKYGLDFGSSQHVLARYLKIHHNTDPTSSTNNAVGETQSYLSAYNTLARSEVFRNGQDAARGAGDYFTLEEDYLHDTYCNHPDGIQSFVPTSNSNVPDDAGEVRGLVVRRSIFDRIGLQDVFLGENVTHNSWNVDVTIQDNLFLNSSYGIKSKHGDSTNWKVVHNTFVNGTNFGVEWCCATPGAKAPMLIDSNIFVQIKEGTTAFYLPTGGGNTAFSNNCLYRSGSRSGNVSESGTINADPRFVNPAGGDFSLQSSSPCAGKGSAVTSVAQLLAGSAAVAGSVPTSTATAQPTTASTATPVPPTATQVPPTATQPPAPTATTPPTAQPTAQPSTVTLTFIPSADVYVDAGYPTANNGTDAIVRTWASPEQRSYLRFNVQGVGSRRIKRVWLWMYANGSSTDGFIVRKVGDNSWDERTTNYSNKPNMGGFLANSGSHGGARYVTVDITGYITGDGTYSLALTTKSPRAVSYPSREAPSNQPLLVIEAGP